MFEKGKLYKPASLLVLGWAGVNALLALITMYWGMFCMIDYVRDEYVIAFFMGFAKAIVYAAFILVAIMGLKKKVKAANLIGFILIAIIIVWSLIRGYVLGWGHHGGDYYYGYSNFFGFHSVLDALSVELAVAIGYLVFINKSSEE